MDRGHLPPLDDDDASRRTRGLDDRRRLWTPAGVLAVPGDDASLEVTLAVAGGLVRVEHPGNPQDVADTAAFLRRASELGMTSVDVRAVLTDPLGPPARGSLEHLPALPIDPGPIGPALAAGWLQTSVPKGHLVLKFGGATLTLTAPEGNTVLANLDRGTRSRATRLGPEARIALIRALDLASLRRSAAAVAHHPLDALADSILDGRDPVDAWWDLLRTVGGRPDRPTTLNDLDREAVIAGVCGVAAAYGSQARRVDVNFFRATAGRWFPQGPGAEIVIGCAGARSVLRWDRDWSLWVGNTVAVTPDGGNAHAISRPCAATPADAHCGAALMATRRRLDRMADESADQPGETVRRVRALLNEGVHGWVRAPWNCAYLAADVVDFLPRLSPPERGEAAGDDAIVHGCREMLQRALLMI